MPPAAPASQTNPPRLTPGQQTPVGPALRSESLMQRAGGDAAGEGAGNTDTAGQPPQQAGPQDEDETTEDMEPEEIQNEMDRQRFLKINAQRTAQQQEKAEKVGQAVVMTLGKSPWGRALLLGIKYVLKVVSLFGQNCVGFVVTFWVVGIPLNIMFGWVPIFGVFIAWFFSAIFAIPMQSYIYPRLKPYVDEITKQTSLMPKAAEMKGAPKLPGR